ncbi:MAG: hypothetical protein JWO38_856 [Gemmataceae bacterium]|nr:hypothetical protein [Gemmataceae bacterium]
MPTINKPFLLKVLIVVAALAGLLMGGHTLQARRIPDALKRQADRAADAGKTDSAVHYLRQYLEFEPDDVEALDQLVGLLRVRDPSTRGYTELILLTDKILRLDPDRHPARREALTACLRMARYSDAVTHADALLVAFPAEAALWQQLGAAHTGLNQLTEARKSYENAITYAPGEMLGYQQLAQLVWKNMNKPAEAKKVLDQMVAAMPQEPQAYYARARFDSYLAEEGFSKGQTTNTDAAVRDLRRVLELDPENADASLLLAEILQKGRDIPAAHAILRDAASLYPRDLRLIRSLSWLELVRGNVPAAMAVLEDGLKHSPDGFDLLVPLADLLVQQGDSTRSADILKQLEARRAPSIQVKYLKARLAMRNEKWAEAVGLLEALRTEALNLPGLEAQLHLLLAACFEKTADSDPQEKALKRVTGADPGNVPARVGLATLYLNQGRFDDAAREYESAAQSPYAPGGILAQWVRLQARRLRTRGGSADEWRKLEQAAAGAVAKFGLVSSEPVILRADTATAQGKYAEALQLLRTDVTRRPGDTRLWAVIVETAALASGTAAGLTVLDEAQAVAGDGPDIRLARAVLYAREPGRVRPIGPLADRIDTWSDADQLRLLYGLVEVYDQTGERAKVVQMLRRIAANRPTDLGVWLRLHERATDAGDAAAAAEARAALVKIEGEGGPSVVLCDAGTSTDPRVTDRLLTAFGTSPNRADACLVLAKVKAAGGDSAEAVRLTRRAFLLEPTRYETARAWVALLCRTGAGDQGAKVVAQLAADPRWAGEPFRRMIAGVIDRVPPADGATVASWCKPLVERDPGGLGWLAGRYTAVGKPSDVEAALVAATKAPSATGDDWLRLALHHAAGGRRDAAVEVVTAARRALPPMPFFALAATFCETPGGKEWTPALTDPAEKRAFAQAQLAVKLSRPDSGEARKVLDQFLAGADVRRADIAWARRNLAMLCAITGSADDRRQAMELLDNSKDGETTPEDLRATASVLSTLARYLDGDDRKAVLALAAAALQVVHKKNESPRDLYNLSQLYRVAGNRVESRKCLQQLLNSDPKNIYYLIAALEEVTEAREFPAGETFAKFLWAHHQGEFRAVAAVARYECKTGRADRALALAEGYASAADAGAGDYLTRSARVAELLDELARYPGVRGTAVGGQMAAAAVERYAALVPSRPEAVVAIVGLLAAEGRVPDAFAKIDQYARYLPVRVRALAGLAAVRSGGATERQFTTVGTWIAEAVAEEPDAIPVRLNEAELLALRQEASKAEEVYTAILRRDPRNVVALNNLSWLLAADPRTAQRAHELIDRAIREAGLTGELLDTRARVRITLKQFVNAQQDSAEALNQESTALRWFHIAVLRMSQSPPQKDDAVKAFGEARKRGLDPRGIHPADLPVYKILDADMTQHP